MSDEEVAKGAEVFDDLDRAEQGVALEGFSDDEDHGRSRRRRTSRAKEARMESLKALRAGNRDRALHVEDDLVYDEVDEAEYRRIVRDRQEHDDFIVDDGTGDFLEYADHGGEIWDEEDFAGESDAVKRARRRKGAFGSSSKAPKKPKARVNSLFTGGGKSNKLGGIKMDNDGGEDSFLKELLAQEGADLDEAPAVVEPKQKKKPKSWGFQQLVLSGTLDPVSPPESGPTSSHVSASAPSHSARRARPAPAVDYPDQHDVGDDGGFEIDHSRHTTSSAKRGREGEDMSPASSASARTLSSTKSVSTVPAGSAAAAAVATAFSSASKVPGSSSKSAPPPQGAPASAAKKNVRVLAMPEEDEDDGEAPSYLVCSKAPERSEDWQRVREQEAQAQAKEPEVPEVEVDAMQLPLVTNEDGSKILRLYWLDAYEGEGPAAGVVYLFGKVWVPEAKKHTSCSVAVKGVERNIFVLPRESKLDSENQPTIERVDMSEVYEEVSELLLKAGIKKFFCKPVTRKYAFELADVPAEATFLKIKYPVDQQQARLAPDLSGRTFSHILGTSIGPLERFLMKRDLMGPCWLDIKDVHLSRQLVTWCKLEGETLDPKNVVKTKEPPTAPPVVVLSLSMQTILNRKTHQNEIIFISGVVHSAVQLDGPTESQSQITHFTAMRKLGDTPLPPDFKSRLLQSKNKSASIEPTERALIGQFMARLYKIDPDIIVGHDILGFDLDVLLHRIKANNIPHWSRIGRLRRNVMPKLQAGGGGRANYAERTVACGRLLCDVKVSAREFIRIVNYELSELAHTQLETTRHDIDPEAVPGMYSQSDSLLMLTDHVERDAYLILQLMFKLDVLPLSKQITSVTGGLLARTFAGGRAERNEYLLCHEFHRNKFIVPDKQFRTAAPEAVVPEDGEGEEAPKSKSARRKPAYMGGLVLEPKRGFYDKYILLLDFNSLYPSIIQEYNICFTTVKRHGLTEGTLAELPDSTLERGILPRVLKTLIAKRKAVKELIKTERSPEKLAEYDIRQKALKLTANSMYGCLGFAGSRFFARPLAELITAKGREILQKTVDMARDSLGLDVIYGDTDSVMINTRSTDLAEVKAIGGKVRKEVNGLYRELEIDIDGVFKTMLLLKKKKYAALAIKEKNGEIKTVQETKGLDMVRRDWCVLSHDVGNFILGQILSRESREDLIETCHEFLRRVAVDVATPGRIPVEKYVIHKGLTKNPEEYADKQNQPHVQVALRMKAAGKSVRAMDTIPYVVAEDGTTNPATQRAYHPDDLRKNPALKIDTHYYLANQIHPVVSRLIEPIEGTDNVQIAECLGLDASSYQKGYAEQGDDEAVYVTVQRDEDRFRTAEPLKIRCLACGETSEFPGVFRTLNDTRRCSLLCPTPSCSATFPAVYLCNILTLAMRSHIDQYCNGATVCDDPSCPRGGRESRSLSVMGRRCLDEQCRGEVSLVYSVKKLYTQLTYYQHLFNAKKAVDSLPEAERGEGALLLAGHMDQYEIVFKHVQKTVKKSAYNTVSLGSLFQRVDEHRPAPLRLVPVVEEDLEV